MVKINIDGSALDNPGKIEVGGILMDSQGELIYAFTTLLWERYLQQNKNGTNIFWCIMASAT